MKEARKITKAQILQELDRLPDEVLVKVLEYLRSLDTVVKNKSISFEKKISEENSEIDRQAWQAYLDSERERKEVYRRLANS